MQCTPGNWQAIEDRDGSWRVVAVNGNGDAAPVALCSDGDDAQLLAAAPKLYETLRTAARLAEAGFPDPWKAIEAQAAALFATLATEEV